MSGELDQIRERLVQARNTRAAELADRASARPASDAAAGGTFLAGDRVFDSVSGLDGTVLSSPTLRPAQAAVVTIKVDDGRILLRPAEQLIARPTPATRK